MAGPVVQQPTGLGEIVALYPRAEIAGNGQGKIAAQHPNLPPRLARDDEHVIHAIAIGAERQGAGPTDFVDTSKDGIVCEIFASLPEPGSG